MHMERREHVRVSAATGFVSPRRKYRRAEELAREENQGMAPAREDARILTSGAECGRYETMSGQSRAGCRPSLRVRRGA